MHMYVLAETTINTITYGTLLYIHSQPLNPFHPPLTAIIQLIYPIGHVCISLPLLTFHPFPNPPFLSNSVKTSSALLVRILDT